MTLHLVKLCVGADSLADLKAWQDRVRKRPRAKDRPPEPYHVTRMFPKEREQVLDGGSLYWVIKRVIQVRQRILDLAEIIGDDGVRRCAIVLEPKLVLTQPAPRRAFQGWRYLKSEDAPGDLDAAGGGGADLPEPLRRKLVELGAW